jgi:hypothetical protein
MEKHIQGEKVMAIFKPEDNGSTGSSYLGVVEVGIVGFEDKANLFEWADIFIEVELSIKNSEYTNRMSILGSLDKDATGKITGGSVLKKMYRVFDAIGCTAGLTIDGKWEDEHGNEIDDIGHFLKERYCTKGEQYVSYLYKKKPKPGKKVYTEVYPRLYPNTAEGKAACKKDTDWLKSQGHIKEATETDMIPDETSSLADSALSNL